MGSQEGAGVRKRCPYCRRLFRADPRQKSMQKTCGAGECQKKRRKENARRWREKNPGYDSSEYRDMRHRDRREWKRKYWASHPEYRHHHAEYIRQHRGVKRLPENSVSIPYREIEVKYSKQSTILEITGVRVPYRVMESILLKTKDHEVNLRV